MCITKRLLSLALALALLLGLWACGASPFQDGAQNGTSGGSGDGEDFTPPTYTEVVKTTFEKSYADQLSPNEKHIYDKIAALTPGVDSVELSLPEQPALCRGRAPTEAEQTELKERLSSWTANALYALWLDTPELFWLDHTRYSYSMQIAAGDDGIVRLEKLTLSLTVTGTATQIALQKNILEAATADFKPTGTVAEKVAYINSYLCKRITYDKEAANRASVIGALVDGKCVCEGYARAFAYLAKKADISAVNIPGYATTDEGTEGHMWNAVLIDGTYYAVDATWNDTTKESVYLLVGNHTLCHGKSFGLTHKPDMLTESDAHKAFAFPKISDSAYQGKH